MSSMGNSQATAFQARFQRIETLIQELEGVADPAVRASVEELLQLLLELHGAGLERTLELIWEAGELGQSLIHDHLARDEQVSSLMLLHGLHPLDLETRVRQALAQLRPALLAQGSQVELLGVTAEAGVHLRVIEQPKPQAGCHSCASPPANLTGLIQDTIFTAAPEVTVLEIESTAEAQAGVPIEFIPLIQL